MVAQEVCKRIGQTASLEEAKPAELNMTLKGKKPIKGLKVGDKVSTKKLKEHNLARDSPLTKKVKNWTVESMVVSPVRIGQGKKARMEEKTVLVLKNKKQEATYRTFWIN